MFILARSLFASSTCVSLTESLRARRKEKRRRWPCVTPPLGGKVFKSYFPLFRHPLVPSSPCSPGPPFPSFLPPTEVISLPPLVAAAAPSPSVRRRLLISVIPSISFNVCLIWFLSLSRSSSPESKPLCLLMSHSFFLPLSSHPGGGARRRRPTVPGEGLYGNSANPQHSPNSLEHTVLQETSFRRGLFFLPHTPTPRSNVSFLNEFEIFNYPAVIIYFPP